MSAAKLKKLRGLLERAQHPGTPSAEVATCLKTALRIVASLEASAKKAPKANGSKISEAVGLCRVVRWAESMGGYVAYADDKCLTISTRYVHGKKLYVVAVDGEKLGDMFADLESARAGAEATLWTPEF